MSVRILVVCTGNVCRSPYAHLTLAAALEGASPGCFDVSSAGTHALEGHPVDPGSATILDALGIDHMDFAARQLSAQLMADADVVLTLDRTHRSGALAYSPRHLKRTFTLKELARLIETADARRPWVQRLAGLETVDERWAAMPEHLARERGLSRVDEGADDIADPYRQPQEAFEAMAAEVDAAVATIVELERSFS